MNYLKYFEETNTSNKHPYTWYKDKLYIQYSMNYNFGWEPKIGYLCLVNEMAPKNDGLKVCIIRGDAIELYKNGDIDPGNGLAYSYTKKELDDLDFLTPEELLEKHYDIFISVFNRCVEDIKKDSYVKHYMTQVKKIFNLFEPVIKKNPSAYDDYLARLNSKKYNI